MNKKRILILLILFTAVIGFTIAPTMAAKIQTEKVYTDWSGYKKDSCGNEYKYKGNTEQYFKKNHLLIRTKTKNFVINVKEKTSGDYDSKNFKIKQYFTINSKDPKTKIKSIKINMASKTIKGKWKTYNVHYKNKKSINIYKLKQLINFDHYKKLTFIVNYKK